MRIIEEEQLGFEDVLIRPARSDINSRSEVDVFRTFTKQIGIGHDCDLNGNQHEVKLTASFTCIPICCSNMGSIATPEMAKIFVKKGLLCAMEKHTSKEDLIQMYKDIEAMEAWDGVEKNTYTNRIAISIGTNESLDDLKEISSKCNVNIINVDVANGYMIKLQERIKQVREQFPNSWIIAGTVVTGDIVTDLLNCGADIIRCGIGQGQQCLSRRVAGVGRPTVSMLEECTDAAHQIHGYTMNDGGCSSPGDVCKALGLADFTMIGSLFGGAEEASGETVEKDGSLYKKFAGMSSEYAQNKYFGGFKPQYRSSEGRQTLIKVNGKLSDIIDNILGGIRSCFAYCGCHKMKHWQKHCVFYKVRHQLTATYENAPTFKD